MMYYIIVIIINDYSRITGNRIDDYDFLYELLEGYAAEDNGDEYCQ